MVIAATACGSGSGSSAAKTTTTASASEVAASHCYDLVYPLVNKWISDSITGPSGPRSDGAVLILGRDSKEWPIYARLITESLQIAASKGLAAADTYSIRKISELCHAAYRSVSPPATSSSTQSQATPSPTPAPTSMGKPSKGHRRPLVHVAR